jgi:hypothetical protein
MKPGILHRDAFPVEHAIIVTTVISFALKGRFHSILSTKQKPLTSITAKGVEPVQRSVRDMWYL